MPAALKSTTVATLAAVIILGACGAALKLSFFGLTDSSDYREYVATAQHIAGEEGGWLVPHRFLKPLLPLTLAGLGTAMDYQTATLVQALFFFCALTFAMFLLAREFFGDTFRAALVTLLSILSYPVVKYGIEINAETGALFFYVLSLWLSVKFLKAPSRNIFLANAIVVTIGFLWKEYSIVSAIIFGLVILSHSSLTIASKIRYVLTYAAIFLAVHIPVQVYVYLNYEYTYLSWYLGNATAGFQTGEFTVKTITKSTAALLGLAWLLVPIGLMRFKSFELWQKRFFQTALIPPFMGYVWGYISSRLLYVIAPPFLLVVGMAMMGWSRKVQIAFTALAIAANMTWLFFSYRITL